MLFTRIGEVQSMKTPNYPKNLDYGIPCRWTVHSPELTGILLECDLEVTNDPMVGVNIFLAYQSYIVHLA